MSSEPAPRNPRSRPSWLSGAVPVVFMAVALLLYLLLHSPVGQTVDKKLGSGLGCLSLCGVHPMLTVLSPIAAIWLLAVGATAAIGLSALLRFRGLERILVFGIVVFALITVPAALLGGLSDAIGHHLLRAPWGPLLASLPALAILAYVIRRGWRPAMPRFRPPRLSPLAALLGLLAVGLLLVSLGVATRHPVSGFDALGYHAPLGVFMWRDGTLSDYLTRFKPSWQLSHPGSAELWFGLLRLAGGEVLGILGQLPFALLGAVGVAAFGQRAGLPARATWISAFAWLLVPIVVIGAGREWNDVVAASLLIAVAVLAATPPQSWHIERIAVMGLGLGVVTVTKIAVLPEVAALLLFIAVSLLVTRRQQRRAAAMASAGGTTGPGAEAAGTGGLASRFDGPLTALLVAAGLFLVAVAPWWLRDLALYGNPVYPAILPLYGHGLAQNAMGPLDSIFVPTTWLWPVYLLVEPHRQDSGLGALFAIAIVSGGIVAILRGRRQPLIIIAVMALISLPAWWLYTRHEPRFLLALFGLLIALIPFLLVGVRKRWRPWAAALLGLAAVLSVTVTLTTGLAIDARQPVDRTENYDHLWDADPAVVNLPKSDGLLLDDCGTFNRLYPYLAAGQTRQVARVPCGQTAAGIERTMHRYGLPYVYAVTGVDKAALLDARYPASDFELVSRSATTGAAPLERRLYRLIASPPMPGASPRPRHPVASPAAASASPGTPGASPEAPRASPVAPRASPEAPRASAGPVPIRASPSAALASPAATQASPAAASASPAP